MGTEAKPSWYTKKCLLGNVLRVLTEGEHSCVLIVSGRKSLVPKQGCGLSLLALSLAIMGAVSISKSPQPVVVVCSPPS